MAEEKNKFDVDAILKKVFEPQESLKEIFMRRLSELEISPTNSLEILKISHRSLYGILDGTQKRVDISNLITIASFLQMPVDEVIKLYILALEENLEEKTVISSQKIEFIKRHFDLVRLRKKGFIKSVVDFEEIEAKLTNFLGLRSILEYEPPSQDVAFSAGLVAPKDNKTRDFWIQTANQTFREINNPNQYHRDRLIDFFPSIRMHSMSVSLGLVNVIQYLFRLGITVIYQEPLPGINLRGATMAVYGKPCIVLTDYKGFYPTLWFALVHELHHVLFDWPEIKANKYHISEEASGHFTVEQKEEEANEFAREYFFSKEKTRKAQAREHIPGYIKNFAHQNQVHPSFYYVFKAFDDNAGFGKARKLSPEVQNAVQKFSNPWGAPESIPAFSKRLMSEVYLK